MCGIDGDLWRRFAAAAGWVLHWAAPASGARGETHWPALTVTIDPALTAVEQRCVLAHELEHVERGPFPRWATAREEAAVNAAAARKLIGVRELGEALAWSAVPAEVAAELDVDVPTLWARLNHLHPSEVHYLRRRLLCDPPLECGSCRYLTTCKEGRWGT